MLRRLPYVARALIVGHRWLGVALALMVGLWFTSGFVMMYHDFPHIHMSDLYARVPTLNPARINVSPGEAFSRLDQHSRDPSFAVLTTFDGRPVYIGSGTPIIYADDGTIQGAVDDGMIDRAAVEWSGQPLASATKESLDKPDQWTLEGALRTLRPLYKYSWPDGQQVYVNGRTAGVVQYTTRASRFWSYLGPIPHWLYFTSFRTQDASWHTVIVWAAMLTAIVSIAGIAIGLGMYSPTRRYSHAGVATSIPYRGWKRWHTVTGLVFGIITTTWAFSGWLSMGPFDVVEQFAAWTTPTEPQSAKAGDALTGLNKTLRGGRLEFSRYDAKPPAAAIASVPGFTVKELEYASFEGEAIYLAFNDRGETRIIPVAGQPMDMFDPHALIRRIRTEVGGHLASAELLDRYDAYYIDRRGEKPLPIIRVRFKDAQQSRYYIDPTTAMVVATYSRGSWVDRWAYHGLHSLDFPWLYHYRPLWDIVVITLLLGGTALCFTSLALAWKVATRRAVLGLTRLAQGAAQPWFGLARARTKTAARAPAERAQ